MEDGAVWREFFAKDPIETISALYTESYKRRLKRSNYGVLLKTSGIFTIDN